MLPALPPLPAFRLPPVVARLGARLPAWPPAVAIAGALNLAVMAGLLPAGDVAALAGRRFRIRVIDVGAVIDLTVVGGRFHRLGTDGAMPDLLIAAPLSSFLQLLARQADPDTLFFERRLQLEGNTELGLQVKNLLDAVDFDRLRDLPLPGLRRHGSR